MKDEFMSAFNYIKPHIICGTIQTVLGKLKWLNLFLLVLLRIIGNCGPSLTRAC